VSSASTTGTRPLRNRVRLPIWALLHLHIEPGQNRQDQDQLREAPAGGGILPGLPATQARVPSRAGATEPWPGHTCLRLCASRLIVSTIAPSSMFLQPRLDRGISFGWISHVRVGISTAHHSRLNVSLGSGAVIEYRLSEVDLMSGTTLVLIRQRDSPISIQASACEPWFLWRDVPDFPMSELAPHEAGPIPAWGALYALAN
jgi:hypothetical protein